MPRSINSGGYFFGRAIAQDPFLPGRDPDFKVSVNPGTAHASIELGDMDDRLRADGAGRFALVFVDGGAGRDRLSGGYVVDGGAGDDELVAHPLSVSVGAGMGGLPFGEISLAAGRVMTASSAAAAMIGCSAGRGTTILLAGTAGTC
jgi:hypothetical protein